MNYIIFDLEATCWEDKHKHTSEIIEIGALKIIDNEKVVDEFSAFIKPVLEPKLSEFCTKLTTIKQSDVDAAKGFPEVVDEFKKWVGVGETDYQLCSWGFYDRKQLTQDSEFHRLDANWLAKHISIKHQHQILTNLERPLGLGKAISHEKMEFEGTAHRGIDDARNIAKIFLKYFGMWKLE